MEEQDLVEQTLEAHKDEAVETEEQEVDWEARAKKAEELANNYKIRAEKAEKTAKSKQEEVATPNGATESNTTDTIAMLRAGVPEEDEQVVIKAAKSLGVTVKEALQDDVVKEILKRKAEERKTQMATHTGETVRSRGTLSDEALLQKARNGELPESDTDMKRLASLHARGIK